MTKIISKPLPHSIGVTELANPELKRIVALIMENFKSEHAQLAATQKAIIELQRRT